jgi:hypothetical protein
MVKDLNNIENMTTEDKEHYLSNVVYEAITHSHTGKLLINTFYCRKVAKILGGDYDKLTKVQKFLLKSDIVAEIINVPAGIERYLKY